MKYKEVKEALINKGFVLEWCQSAGVLDAVTFISPTYCSETNDGITIEFDCKEEDLPINIRNHEEFSYDDKWIEELDVKNILFNIDKGISFGVNGCSNNVLLEYEYKCSGNYKTNPSTLYLFSYFLDIFTTDDYIHFCNRFLKEYLIFTNIILNKFKPILNRFKCSIQSFNMINNYDIVPQYCDKSINYVFKKPYGNVIFYFDNVTWKMFCQIQIYPLITEEEMDGATFDLNCDINLFETELNKQIKLQLELEEKYYLKKNII